MELLHQPALLPPRCCCILAWMLLEALLIVTNACNTLHGFHLSCPIEQGFMLINRNSRLHVDPMAFMCSCSDADPSI